MNPFKQFIKEFNSYSRGDRNAIIILCILIFIVIIANQIVKNTDPDPVLTPEELEAKMKEVKLALQQSEKKTKLFSFNPNTISGKMLDSLDIPEKVKHNILKYRTAGGRFYTVDDVRKIYGMNDSLFSAIESYIRIERRRKKIPVEIIKKQPVVYSGYFDPNTADSSELVKFGFAGYQIKTLLNYRSKGGIFRSPADLLKVYGIDSAFYKRVLGNIKIEVVDGTNSNQEIADVYKVELNRADSAALVKLKGIGAVYARRIIKYRNLLGGFYSKEQLLEVYGFSPETFSEIESHIEVDTMLIKKIRINFCGFKDLLRHPYLDKKQVKALLGYRDKNGAFNEIADIRQVSEIDNETYSKISRYITCR